MINLLSPQEREKILKRIKKKIITILLFLFLFFVVCLILILLSIKIYIQQKVEEQKIIFESVKGEFETVETMDFYQNIESLNLVLLNLNNFYKNKVYLVELLEKISKILPQGMELKNLSASSVNLGGKDFFKFELSGFAENREVLFELKKNLEKEPNLRDIYFPPSNWIKAEDIDFSVIFSANTQY